MRFEDGFDSAWREILGESVSAGESTELLERLASDAEFGNQRITISAICEATGSTPQLVSRILADIRGVSWQKEFGDRLTALDSRIDQHAEILSRHETKISQLRDLPESPSRQKDEDVEIEAEIRSIAKQRIQQREMAPIITIFSLIVMLFIFAIIASVHQRSVAAESEYGISVGTGRTVWVDGNGATYTKDAQGKRKPVEPTVEEQMAIMRSETGK